VTLWASVADLPLRIDGYELRGLRAEVSSEFEELRLDELVSRLEQEAGR